MPQIPPVQAMTNTVPIVNDDLSLRPPQTMKMFPGQIYIPNLKNSNTEVLQPLKPSIPIIPKEAPLLAPAKASADKAKPKKEKVN